MLNTAVLPAVAAMVQAALVFIFPPFALVPLAVLAPFLGSILTALRGMLP
jgi:hypothetical protein